MHFSCLENDAHSETLPIDRSFLCFAWKRDQFVKILDKDVHVPFIFKLVEKICIKINNLVRIVFGDVSHSHNAATS